MPHLRALKDRDLEADARSAYGWLRENRGAEETPIACIGFCMGGRVSFLTNSVLMPRRDFEFRISSFESRRLGGGQFGFEGLPRALAAPRGQPISYPQGQK